MYQLTSDGDRRNTFTIDDWTLITILWLLAMMTVNERKSVYEVSKGGSAPELRTGALRSFLGLVDMSRYGAALLKMIDDKGQMKPVGQTLTNLRKSDDEAVFLVCSPRIDIPTPGLVKSSVIVNGLWKIINQSPSVRCSSIPKDEGKYQSVSYFILNDAGEIVRMSGVIFPYKLES